MSVDGFVSVPGTTAMLLKSHELPPGLEYAQQLLHFYEGKVKFFCMVLK